MFKEKQIYFMLLFYNYFFFCAEEARGSKDPSPVLTLTQTSTEEQAIISQEAPQEKRKLSFDSKLEENTIFLNVKDFSKEKTTKGYKINFILDDNTSPEIKKCPIFKNLFILGDFGSITKQDLENIINLEEGHVIKIHRSFPLHKRLSASLICILKGNQQTTEEMQMEQDAEQRRESIEISEITILLQPLIIIEMPGETDAKKYEITELQENIEKVESSQGPLWVLPSSQGEKLILVYEKTDSEYFDFEAFNQMPLKNKLLINRLQATESQFRIKIGINPPFKERSDREKEKEEDLWFDHYAYNPSLVTEQIIEIRNMGFCREGNEQRMIRILILAKADKITFSIININTICFVLPKMYQEFFRQERKGNNKYVGIHSTTEKLKELLDKTDNQLEFILASNRLFSLKDILVFVPEEKFMVKMTEELPTYSAKNCDEVIKRPWCPRGQEISPESTHPWHTFPS